jgi:hypothetical protein
MAPPSTGDGRRNYVIPLSDRDCFAVLAMSDVLPENNQIGNEADARYCEIVADGGPLQRHPSAKLRLVRIRKERTPRERHYQGRHAEVMIGGVGVFREIYAHRAGVENDRI